MRKFRVLLIRVALMIFFSPSRIIQAQTPKHNSTSASNPKHDRPSLNELIINLNGLQSRLSAAAQQHLIVWAYGYQHYFEFASREHTIYSKNFAFFLLPSFVEFFFFSRIEKIKNSAISINSPLHNRW